MNQECSNTTSDTATPENLALAQGLGDRGNDLAVRVDGRIGIPVMSADGKDSTRVVLA